MSNDRRLTDAEIVEIILGRTTPGEYKQYAPSVLAIWRPRFDQASAKTAASMQAELDAAQSHAYRLEKGIEDVRMELLSEKIQLQNTRDEFGEAQADYIDMRTQRDALRADIDQANGFYEASAEEARVAIYELGVPPDKGQVLADALRTIADGHGEGLACWAVAEAALAAWNSDE